MPDGPRIGRTRIGLHASLALALPAVWADASGLPAGARAAAVAGFLVCLAVHEAGHIRLLRRSSEDAVRVKLTAFGGLDTGAGPASDRGGAWRYALGGTFAGLLFALLLHALSPFLPGADGGGWRPVAHLVARWSVLLALLSLVPAYPLDAAFALHRTLVPFFGAAAPGRWMARGGRVAAVALALWGLADPLEWLPLALALLLWHAAGVAQRTGIRIAGAAPAFAPPPARAGGIEILQADEIEVSPPPYARAAPSGRMKEWLRKARSWTDTIWNDT